MTQIGNLDKRITLEASTMVGDGMGGFSASWISVLPVGTTIFAAIWPVSATEQIRSAAPTMVATHRIRIRYRTVLKASWRVLYNGRYFSIVSITDPNEAHEWFDLLCKEVIA